MQKQKSKNYCFDRRSNRSTSPKNDVEMTSFKMLQDSELKKNQSSQLKTILVRSRKTKELLKVSKTVLILDDETQFIQQELALDQTKFVEKNKF
jgi:hypothetical protein